jgi:hypothetical protein
MVNIKPGMVANTFNSSTWETELGGLPVQDQLGLRRETLSQKTNQSNKKLFKNYFLPLIS